MNNLDKKYTDLLQDILDNGVKKEDRTGTGTLSVFGRQIRHKMSEGFSLLTTKKMPFKTITTELLWFLRGDTNIKFLVDNNCHIWDGDAYKNYCKSFENQSLIEQYSFDTAPMTKEMFISKIKNDDVFAKKWGDLGPIYGAQWRSWSKFEEYKDAFEVDILEENEDSVSFTMGTSGMIYEIDQIQNSINLLKEDPDSRRNKVTAWNVGEIDKMTLPPCHTDFQFYTRELSLEDRIQFYYKSNCSNGKSMPDKILKEELKSERTVNMLDKLNIPTRAISLMWNQRSVDTFLGLPFNIASYGLLLEIIAKEVNMIPDELIGNLGDTHLYLDHIEQAKEQIGRELSLDERKKLYENEFTPGMEVKNDEWLQSKLTTREIPKRTREPYPLPKLNIHPGILDYDLDKLEIGMFTIENYQSHPAIKAPLSN